MKVLKYITCRLRMTMHLVLLPDASRSEIHPTERGGCKKRYLILMFVMRSVVIGDPARGSYFKDVGATWFFF